MRILVNQFATPHRQQQQPGADGRGFEHFAHPPEAHVTAHEQRNGNRCAHGENAPGTFGEGFDNDEREHREQNHQNRQNRQHRDEARRCVQFLLHHLAERFAVTPHRTKQDYEVLHRAAEHDADENPQRAGQITELRGEHRPDERPRPGNGREVMAEDNPFVRFDEILAVVVDLARCGAAVVKCQQARGNPFGVKPVADGVGADRRDENVGGVDRLAPAKRQRGIRCRAGQGEQEPEKRSQNLFHTGWFAANLQFTIYNLRE